MESGRNNDRNDDDDVAHGVKTQLSLPALSPCFAAEKSRFLPKLF
jgi:hypothetical protein